MPIPSWHPSPVLLETQLHQGPGRVLSASAPHTSSTRPARRASSDPRASATLPLHPCHSPRRTPRSGPASRVFPDPWATKWPAYCHWGKVPGCSLGSFFQKWLLSPLGVGPFQRYHLPASSTHVARGPWPRAMLKTRCAGLRNPASRPVTPCLGGRGSQWGLRAQKPFAVVSVGRNGRSRGSRFRAGQCEQFRGPRGPGLSLVVWHLALGDEGTCSVAQGVRAHRGGRQAWAQDRWVCLPGACSPVTCSV